MPHNNSAKRIRVEVCADTLASALAAQNGGAARIELCSALSEGGLTPSAGMIKQARALLSIGIFVMIRPRTGNFSYSDDDFNAMLLDITFAKQIGADGIVSGILNQDGSVDVKRTSRLVQAANPLPFTFHRAFDCTPYPLIALEDIIKCGCARILTSGHQTTAIEGKELIRKLIQQSAGRIIILPGSGVNEKNVDSLIKATGAFEVHLSGRKKLTASQNGKLATAGEAAFQLLYETDPVVIRMVVNEANSASGGEK